MISKLDPTPKLLDMPADEYHADYSRVSHSMLEVFRESPRLYYGRFVTREYAGDESDSFDFGTAAHAMLLEDKQVYVPIPRDALNADGHRKGAAWKQFAAENEGKILLTPDQQSTLEKMVAEIRRHDKAMRILNCRGQRENVIHWTDQRTGIDMKCRMDITPEGLQFIADYKTSANVRRDKLESTIDDFGYARQADLYCDAVESLTGNRPQFLFVFQLKTPPYTVRVFPLSGSYLTIGRLQNHADLAALSACIYDDHWDDEGHGRLEQPIEPSPWVIKKNL